MSVGPHIPCPLPQSTPYSLSNWRYPLGKELRSTVFRLLSMLTIASSIVRSLMITPFRTLSPCSSRNLSTILRRFFFVASSWDLVKILLLLLELGWWRWVSRVFSIWKRWETSLEKAWDLWLRILVMESQGSFEYYFLGVLGRSLCVFWVELVRFPARVLIEKWCCIKDHEDSKALDKL